MLEAEKFRASIAVPNPGETSHFVVQEGEHRNVGDLGQHVSQAAGLVNGGISIPIIGGGVSDDDFFHLTCHIDPSLFLKIEKGEFVELEKLLLRIN